MIILRGYFSRLLFIFPILLTMTPGITLLLGQSPCAELIAISRALRKTRQLSDFGGFADYFSLFSWAKEVFRLRDIIGRQASSTLPPCSQREKCDEL